MFDLNAAVRLYKYEMASIDILFQGDSSPTNIDKNHINNIYIENDYEENFFPMFRLSLTMAPKLYNRIIREKLTVRFRIRLQKYIYKNEETFLFKEDIINNIFCIYLDDSTPFVDEKLYDKTKEVEQIDSGTSLSDFAKEFEFFLFKEKDVNDTKNITNTVLTSATMTDAFTYLFAKNGFKNILLSPFDNKQVYSEILIKPITMLGNLMYLEQQYGLYNTGSLMFFDFNCIYIVEKTPKCKAWRPNEFKQTVFTIKESMNNASVFSTGSYEDNDSKKYYINVTPGNYQTINRSVISDQIEGNNLLVINPLEGNSNARLSDSIQRGPGTYKVLTNKYNSTMQINAEVNNRNEKQLSVMVTIGDFDINAISPNKEFMFIFENATINSQYGGLYRMSKQYIELMKKGGEYHITGNCTLRRQTL